MRTAPTRGEPAPARARPRLRRARRRAPARATARNRLLFEPSELSGSAAPHVVLPASDPRALHAKTYLLQFGEGVGRKPAGRAHAHGGGGPRALDADGGRWAARDADPRPHTLKVGTVGGAAALATATLLPCGSLRLDWLPNPAPPPSAASRQPPARPPVALDLLLALPRPKALKRLLCACSQLGVRQVVLCGAASVEPSYWGSHLLRRPALARAELVRGAEQAGATALPCVAASRRLGAALAAALAGPPLPPPPAAGGGDGGGGCEGERAPPDGGGGGGAGGGLWWPVPPCGPAGALAAAGPPGAVLVAHPTSGGGDWEDDADGFGGNGAPRGVAAALAAAAASSAAAAAAAPPLAAVLLAIGPEGGWAPHELRLLEGLPPPPLPAEAAGWGGGRGGGAPLTMLQRAPTPLPQPRPGRARVSLGWRTLATETAAVALLAAAREALGGW